MGRHGDRYPLGSELPFTQGLVTKLAAGKAAIEKAKLPESLAFLKKGYASTLGACNSSHDPAADGPQARTISRRAAARRCLNTASR